MITAEIGTCIGTGVLAAIIIANNIRQGHADGPTNRGHDGGFGEELQQNVAAARAQRFAQADFARPLGHCRKHHVHDHHAADHQEHRDDSNH